MFESFGQDQYKVQIDVQQVNCWIYFQDTNFKSTIFWPISLFKL